MAAELQLRTDFDDASRWLANHLAASGFTPSEHAIQREHSVLLSQALDALPELYREVIILRDFEQLPLSVVAERLNRSPDAVSKMWARAIVKMRRLLEGRS